LATREISLDAAGTRRQQAMREYIATDNINAAIDVDLLLSEKATALASHPRLGRTERAAGTLELVAHQNYVLIYDVAGDIVRVLRVLPVARMWPPNLEGH